MKKFGVLGLSSFVLNYLMGSYDMKLQNPTTRKWCLAAAIVLLIATTHFSLVGCVVEERNAAHRKAGARQKPSDIEAMEHQLLHLEWQIAQKSAAANGIALAPVIPGRTDVIPYADPFSERYHVVRGPSIYVEDATNKVENLHNEIDDLRRKYDALEKAVRAKGWDVPKLAKCKVCEGRGLAAGPHYELGRREDGSLGLVFSSGGLHCCKYCGGAGVQPPDSK
jgi:hypothetical protein